MSRPRHRATKRAGSRRLSAEVRGKTHFRPRKAPSHRLKYLVDQWLGAIFPSLPAAEFEAVKRGWQRIGRGIGGRPDYRKGMAPNRPNEATCRGCLTPFGKLCHVDENLSI